MSNIIASVSRSAFARQVVRGLRLHKLGNAWLRRFPKIKRLPGGIVWRASRMESFALAHEMFEKGNLYDPALLPANFTTFADLGCNVGYFTCWLADQAKGRKLNGVMMDANPDAVAEANWHAQANHLDQVFGIHGILGEDSPSGQVDFYLYESNICSTSQLSDLERMGLKGNWTKISVPCISLEAKWRQQHGDARCNILKVDIEGSELNFLKKESSFLRQVDTIIVEWHKWRVTLDELKAYLESQGFRLIKIIEEAEQMGTACFAR